jgi:UDP-N-acetyl-2-amino-2-deoxyglucuronate dehydrogenase
MTTQVPSARLKLAVIGAGLGAAPHFSSLQDLAGEADLVWVHARNAERLAATPVPDGASKTTRIDDILHDPGVRAVLVLTPPNTHLDIVRQLAQAGKHVLVEKPLEIDLPRASALVQLCEAHGVSLAVMLQHRLREAAVGLRGILAAGELGELVSANASVRWWRPQSYYDEPGRGTLARDGGGVLITQAIHMLDLLLSLIGLPDRVTGVASTSPMHSMEGEDCAAALLHYARGAVAVVQATTAAYPGFAERIELNCTAGSATLESGRLQVNFLSGKTMTIGAAQGSGGGANPMAFDHAAHRTVLQDFIRSVKTGSAPAVSGRSALGVQQVIEAIMRSSQTGRTVAIHPS